MTIDVDDDLAVLLFDIVYAIHPSTVQSAVGQALERLNIQDPLTHDERVKRIVMLDRIRRQAERELEQEERQQS